MDLARHMRQHMREIGVAGRARLAARCGTTVGYLSQIAGGHRRAGVPLALRLERGTAGAVCRCRLRPDVFPPAECADTGRHGEQPGGHDDTGPTRPEAR